MKNRLLLLLMALVSFIVNAQPKTETPSTFVQVMPSYPAGEKALYEFLYNNITYPEQEKAMNIEGTVFVNFIIEKDGTPTNFTITRGVEGGIGLDREALNACKKLGKFTPGTQNGVPQRVFLTIPIKFTLEGDAPEAERALTKKDWKQINKDAEYLCEAMFEIVKTKNDGDTKKYNKLIKKNESKVEKFQKRYVRGGRKEKELERLITPCLEEAMKSVIEK
jgi:TonB family protein